LPKSVKAGRGLFAKSDLFKGDIVAFYDFDKVVDDATLRLMKMDNDPMFPYVLRKRKNQHLCGLMKQQRGRGMGSLINSGGNHFKNNCKIVRFRSNFYIKVVAPLIKIDEELFIPYNRGVIY
jgi:hypothetical protein